MNYRENIKRLAMALMATAMTMSAIAADTVPNERESAVRRLVSQQMPALMGVGSLKVRSINESADTVSVDVSENMGDVPFTRGQIAELKQGIASLYGGKAVNVTIAGNPIEKYYVDFLPEYRRTGEPTFISHLGDAPAALDGKIIATLPSHGWYFEPLLNRWEWQRARLLQTVEDMYTHSYVIPFLMPMLENAGAYVWDARERDTHDYGAVVDADKGLAQSGVKARNGKHKWHKGQGTGFAYKSAYYRDFENPFTEGTYNIVDIAVPGTKPSTMHYDVTMPKQDEYAIYISYKSLPNSAAAVHYTVNSLAGSDEFVVNQTMAGGVWVYLGTFPLAEGVNKDVVVVSNAGDVQGTVVTTDAIRVGGGKGNIERRVALPTEENKAIAARHEDEKYLGKEGIDYQYIGSGDHPWFHLGSRYYLQWAGFPDSVYSTSEGINDYVDDYRSRGEWVNYLAGGSKVLPTHKGLNVPVDVSFCLHTDAGNTGNDSIVGTLLIYCTRKNGKSFGTYDNGTPRILSRRFADMVSTHVVNDIRAKYEPKWMRRGMWDKSYYEARVPEVPALLMELLSHHNYADMKYGLDPQFRFDVSRAIYKGILEFITTRDGLTNTCVQPLPVSAFAITPAGDGKFVLRWEATRDTLVADGALPDSYIVMERESGGAFKRVATTAACEWTASIGKGESRDYRIIAVNKGGRSFPSETLSVGRPKGESKGTVMVVNGFTRVSAPDWFDDSARAGFDDNKDHGVPYIKQINYLGSQYEFRRDLPWRDDDAPGFGASRSDHETEVIAGNTFDYPTLHGAALLKAGYSYVSSSVAAIEDGSVKLTKQYTAVDLAMGKQKEVLTGRGAMPSRYRAFSPQLQGAITAYTQAGGNVLLSGAYVATDIWDNVNRQVDKASATWAEQVLGYTYLNGRASLDGNVTTVSSGFDKTIPAGLKAHFANRLNSEMYAVESPDAIKPSDKSGFTIARYSENNLPAAVATDRGSYRTVVLGFPIETITDDDDRCELIETLMRFLDKR